MKKLAALTTITTLALGGVAEAKATDTGRHSATKQWAYGKVHGQINRHAWISADALRVKR